MTPRATSGVRAVATPAPSGKKIATDGRSLWVAHDIANRILERFNTGDGASRESTTIPSPVSYEAQEVNADQKHLYVAMGDPGGLDGGIYRYTRENLTYSTRSVGAFRFRTVVSDGSIVYAGTDDTNSGYSLYRGNRAALWRKVDPTAVAFAAPFCQLAIPTEGS